MDNFCSWAQLWKILNASTKEHRDFAILSAILVNHVKINVYSIK